jgi:hypothetical protein
MDQDEHVDKDQHHDQVQEESNDQGGDVDKDESNSRPTPPHPRVRHTAQRDHPVNNSWRYQERGNH